MQGLNHFLAMGGYAEFVWPAYVVSLLVLVGLAFASVRAARARRHMLSLLEQQRPAQARRGRREA